MKKIKIKKLEDRIIQNGVLSTRQSPSEWDMYQKINEIIDALSENPELLQETKLSFEERMVGKEYWWLDYRGRKNKETWENYESDNNLLSVSNAFFTESDCDKEIARRKALGNILSYIRDNEIELVKDEDWGNFEIDKFMISGWNYEDNTIDTDICDNVDWSKFSLAFYSQEDRDKVISNCAKDLEILLKK